MREEKFPWKKINITVTIGKPYQLGLYPKKNKEEFLKKSTDEHKIICDAILSGDGEHACNLMRDHMMLQGKRLPSIIATLEQQKNN